MDKKGDMSIAIALLIFCILILFGYAEYVFLVQKEKVDIKINNADIIENVYSKESQINSYIQSIVNKAAAKKPRTEKEFLDFFREELVKYKIGEEYPILQLEQVEEQLFEENVEINQDAVSFKAKLKIDESIKEKEFELISVEYIYEKEFSSEI